MASLPEDSLGQPSEVYTTSRSKTKVLILILVILIGITALIITFSPSFYRNIFSKSLNISPKTQKPGTCLILPQQYCDKAEIIDWTSPSGKKSKMIGIKLPANVPITMPIDGQVAKSKLPEDLALEGLDATISDPNNPNTLYYIIRGDLNFPNMYSLNLKKGEVFGTSQQTGIDNAGGYNVVFYVIRGSGREATTGITEIKEMFSKLK